MFGLQLNYDNLKKECNFELLFLVQEKHTVLNYI